MTTLNILWSDLVATKRNVRKVKTGIESLAASMASEDGQIQNLVVIAREDGKYQVIVGERRRRAAVHNVKTKVWGRDATLRCELRDSQNATSISYAENVRRGMQSNTGSGLCRAGLHPWIEGNVLVEASGTRRCKPCCQAKERVRAQRRSGSRREGSK